MMIAKADGTGKNVRIEHADNDPKL